MKVQQQKKALREGGHAAVGATVGNKPFIGVRGDEGVDGNSLLIAARPGIVLGCRLMVFHKHFDGIFREKRTDKAAHSRIMVTEFKMKNFRIRGSGETDLLPVASVHMHATTMSGI